MQGDAALGYCFNGGDSNLRWKTAGLRGTRKALLSSGNLLRLTHNAANQSDSQAQP